jgi:mannose-1-phosphate guanylyltransferase
MFHWKTQTTMIHAVIMAGGAGTRFWPASRRDCPKQLLQLAAGRTLIQATVDRLGEVVTADNVLIVTNERLVDPISVQLPQLPAAAILGEPCKRDTAPCIGWAALQIARRDPAATMVVMPADHVIGPDERFQAAMRFAAELVEDQPDRLVTFGIRPTYPAESFGYIERGEGLDITGGPADTYRVVQFREKPRADVAQQYLDSGQFYWNSGIFVWKASTIIDQLSHFEPDMHAHLERITEATENPDYPDVLAAEFAAIEGKSIDYAVMEHADNVVVVEAPFDWDDVGSWQSLERLHGTDDHGNTILGRHLGISTHGSIIRTDDDHLIVTLGVQDCIVVHTPDATLVADKNSEEQIREIVRLLEQNDGQEYL